MARHMDKNHGPSGHREKVTRFSRRLCRFERRTASAGARCVWINDPKTGVGQTIAKIQGRAAQIGNAIAIDKKLYPIALHYCVSVFSFVERHLIMQT